MTQHKGQAEGKNAYHYNADNKSLRRAPQGPLLGSSVNHCRSACERGGKLLIATFGPTTSPAINNPMSTTAAHRLVAITAKNARLRRSFGISSPDRTLAGS